MSRPPRRFLLQHCPPGEAQPGEDEGRTYRKASEAIEAGGRLIKDQGGGALVTDKVTGVVLARIVRDEFTDVLKAARAAGRGD